MLTEVLVSGYVSLDRIINIKKVPVVGKTSIVENKTNSDIFFGGCSVNISFLLSKMGIAARPLIRVGSDFESTGFKSYLESAGVDTAGVQIIDSDRTSNCFLLEGWGGDHITLFYPGAQDKKYFLPLEEDAFKHSKLGVLTVGSELDNREFLEKCKRNNLPLVFGMKTDLDAFPLDLLEEILFYSTIIFMNQSEAADIVSLLELDAITDLFKSGQVKIIVVTKGIHGSQYWEKVDSELVSGDVSIVQPKRVLDTTGSGDAYISGFLYAYLNGFSTAEACRMGSTMSSFIIEELGCTTGTPTEKELLQRYEESKNE